MRVNEIRWAILNCDAAKFMAMDILQSNVNLGTICNVRMISQNKATLKFQQEKTK